MTSNKERSNKDVYPVTYRMEGALEKYRGTGIVERGIEYIGEYEHGAVDLPDGIEHVNVLAGTVTDFILYYLTVGEP
jgi:hypothetical protein